jgi:hypothetical protein
MEESLFLPLMGDRFSCYRFALMYANKNNKSTPYTSSYESMNYPAPWIEKYLNEHLYRYDPSLHMMNKLSAETPILYGTLPDALNTMLAETDCEETRAKTRIMTDTAESFGLVSGIYLYYRHGTRLNLLSLNSTDPELCITDQDIAEMMDCILRANHILGMASDCKRCSPRINTDKFDQKKLTESEIRILEFFYHNMDSSAKKVALALSISEHTVNQHLKNIRAKLKKENTPGHALAQMAYSLALIS